MRKTAIISMCVLLSLSLGAYATGEQNDENPNPIDGVDGIGVMDGDEKVPFFSCMQDSTLDQILGGAIPPSNECSHGIYVREGFSITHGWTGLPYDDNNWTGTLQSTLAWAGQNRVYQCVFEDGEIQQDEDGNAMCGGTGVFPSEGEIFRQNCHAFDPYGFELEIAFTEFGCMVTGEVAPQG